MVSPASGCAKWLLLSVSIQFKYVGPVLTCVVRKVVARGVTVLVLCQRRQIGWGVKFACNSVLKSGGPVTCFSKLPDAGISRDTPLLLVRSSLLSDVCMATTHPIYL
jgi:hypothetical protein